jgi:hypothetical protein
MVVYADSVSPVFFPMSQYMDAGSVLKARVTFELRSKVGLIQVRPAIQTVDCESDTPTTTSIVATWSSTTGLTYPTDFTDLDTNTKGKQHARFGFEASLSSTGSLGLVYVTAKVETLGR